MYILYIMLYIQYIYMYMIYIYVYAYVYIYIPILVACIILHRQIFWSNLPGDSSNSSDSQGPQWDTLWHPASSGPRTGLQRDRGFSIGRCISVVSEKFLGLVFNYACYCDMPEIQLSEFLKDLQQNSDMKQGDFCRSCIHSASLRLDDVSTKPNPAW